MRLGTAVGVAVASFAVGALLIAVATLAPWSAGIGPPAQRSGHRIEGRVLLDPGIPAGSFFANLRPESYGEHRAPGRTTLWPRGGFAFDEMPSGSARFTLWIHGVRGACLETRIEIGAKPVQNPVELAELDLRRELQAIDIEVVDGSGGPIETATVWLWNEASGVCGGFSTRGGPVTTVTSRSPLHVEVEADGYRRRRQEGVVASRVAVLEPGLPVTLDLRCEDFPAPPVVVGVDAWLEPPGHLPPRTPIIDPGGEGILLRRHGPRTKMEGPGEWTVLLPEPGVWSFSVYLERPLTSRHRYRRVELGLPPWTLEVAEAQVATSLVLALSSAAIEEALGRMD
ncbi:MAG: carboxypeptidase-like regulatory domain-containing protein [Planctomycetota bacterium]